MIEIIGEVLLVITFCIFDFVFIRELFLNDYWICKLVAGAVCLYGLYRIIACFFS